MLGSKIMRYRHKHLALLISYDIFLMQVDINLVLAHIIIRYIKL
jgi:hypothetical protein